MLLGVLVDDVVCVVCCLVRDEDGMIDIEMGVCKCDLSFVVWVSGGV